jgi:CRP-like cAMP-binding protein
MSALPVSHPPESFIEHPLLSGLSRARVEGLIGRVQPRLVPAGKLLHPPRSRGIEVHLVLAGLLRTYELTPDGREALVELVGPGGIGGFVETPGRQARLIETLEDSLILSLSQSQLEALNQDRVVAVRLTQLLLGMLKHREDQLRLTSVREPGRRLALLLLMLADRLGRPLGSEVLIDCRLTHQALADMAGFRRETVTHALHWLGGIGAVRVASGRFVVKLPALRRIGRTPPQPGTDYRTAPAGNLYL